MTIRIGAPNPFIEIARSYSFKLNCGNYESRDFFCSQKAECRPEDAEAVAAKLHAFCRAQVLREVESDRQTQREALAAPAHPVAQANAREFEKRRSS